jgi:16S rRNA (guanine527-N7)-methyltransferase
MKGKVDEAEIAAVPAGFRVDRIVALQVPATVGERHLIVVRKA